VTEENYALPRAQAIQNERSNRPIFAVIGMSRYSWQMAAKRAESAKREKEISLFLFVPSY
jgi:hypothetical protein